MNLVRRLAARALTSNALRDARRTGARARRLTRGGKRAVQFFWQVDDPYAAVALPFVVRLARAHGLALEARLVPPPDAAAAPEAALLAAYARRDSAALAAALGLPPVAAVPPAEAVVATAERVAAQALVQAAPPETLLAIAQAMVAADPAAALAPLAAALGKASPAATARALAHGAAARASAGHYLGSVTHFEGEFYWGIDRLHYLEARLAGDAALCPRLDPVMPPVAALEGPAPVLDFYLSFRSPYTMVAAERIGALAAHYGATLNLRFVLPMVMRGLPVPGAKRRYITLDTKREAARFGLPFGDIVDPVGLGVERGLAVLHHAIAAGRGLDFARAFLTGAFARGIDMTGDALFAVAAGAGIGAEAVRAALADDSWRTVAEENRTALFALGLWGVPSFQVAGRAPHWGQDRLWAVEDDLRTVRGLPPIDRRVPCEG
ncbi:DsbA family protein [Sphingomonas sp.]|uniref:DsbA family protein n=1 Tax=Sphingomonas sp. TaxID=28214 RepID=UPI001D49F794|nr:DsbA family protein [Sphingomonas sp.]MBX9795385.1 DsbA family protein [Sphingomonas sp.]